MSVPFKKMRLIQDEEYERLRQKQVSSYNPELRVMAHLEDEMRDIMDSRNISPEDKLKLFEQLRLRSNDVKNQAKEEIALGGVSAMAAPTAGEKTLQPPVLLKQEVKKEDPIFEHIIGRVSPKHKDDAAKLFEILNSNPNILSVNDNEELIVNGKTIPNTKFSEIFTSLYTDRQTKSLERIEGIPSFLHALNSLNVPKSLIHNKTLSKGLEELSIKPKLTRIKKSQTGTGISVPGKIQRILRVYRV